MTSLNETEIHALHEALDDEYKSWATYDQVITDFGEVSPFINIRDAEARHIQALHMLFARYGLIIPENPWPGKVPCYSSIKAACEDAVAGEVANGDMYVQLFKATARPDILDVFRNLRDASVERHLPAFQRCTQRGEGQHSGGGGRRRRFRGGRCS